MGHRFERFSGWSSPGKSRYPSIASRLLITCRPISTCRYPLPLFPQSLSPITPPKPILTCLPYPLLPLLSPPLSPLSSPLSDHPLCHPSQGQWSSTFSRLSSLSSPKPLEPDLAKLPPIHLQAFSEYLSLVRPHFAEYERARRVLGPEVGGTGGPRGEGLRGGSGKGRGSVEDVFFEESFDLADPDTFQTVAGLGGGWEWDGERVEKRVEAMEVQGASCEQIFMRRRCPVSAQFAGTLLVSWYLFRSHLPKHSLLSCHRRVTSLQACNYVLRLCDCLQWPKSRRSYCRRSRQGWATCWE